MRNTMGYGWCVVYISDNNYVDGRTQYFEYEQEAWDWHRKLTAWARTKRGTYRFVVSAVA